MTALPTATFGPTDLRVTRLCQGTAFRTLARDETDPRAEAVVRHCLDVGVTFFDSATAYGWGGSERMLGQALRGRRDEVVICTKVLPGLEPSGDGPWDRVPFTREFLRQQCEASLRRLRTEVIDLYLLHQPDPETPPEAQCEHMQRLIDEGRIRHWGVSNHTAAAVRALLEAAEATGTTPPCGLEDYYTVGGTKVHDDGLARVRRYEEEMFPLLRERGLGLLAFGPMDRGTLAPGEPVEGGSPLETMIAAIDEAAAEMGVSRAQLCVAWVLSHPEVTCVLGGAETPAHVEEMAAGTRLQVPEELKERLWAASRIYTAAMEAAARCPAKERRST